MGVLPELTENLSEPQCGFEGFEKRLEIDFFPGPLESTLGMRSLSRAQIQDILNAARCMIVSELSNNEVDSYILSESSLFVYPHTVVLKTCGTTKLLHAILVILNHAAHQSMKVRSCRYSRGSFIFPLVQPYPHGSFSDEVEYLDGFFGRLGSGSKAYMMGSPSTAQKWHIYYASAVESEVASEMQPIYTLEMCMTKLDTGSASNFFKTNCPSAVEMTHKSGISELLPNASVCDYAFDPCGYSMNSLEKSAISTVHVTPESGYSYASFETMGYSSQDVLLQSLVDSVLSCFRPASFSIALHISGLSGVRLKGNSWIAPVLPQGYDCDGFSVETLPGGSMVMFYTFIGHQVCFDGPNGSIPLDLKSSSRVHLKALDNVITGHGGIIMQERLHHAFDLETEELIATISPVVIGATSKGLDEFIKNQIKSTGTEEAFYVMDIGVLLRLWKKWQSSIPRVHPFYAVKCNSDRVLLALLSSLGAGFDVASKAELDMVKDLGVGGDRIIFANPCKLPSHIQHACNSSVHLTTFDSEAELFKLHKWNPRAEAVIRIRVCDAGARCPLGVEYGAEMEECEGLLCVARGLGLQVVGVAFHVGSGASDPSSFAKGIVQARQVYDIARAMGLPSFRLLDIGGGFVSDRGYGVSFSAAAASINEALETYFPPCLGITVIAEPGRFFAEETFTLAAQVFGKRMRSRNGQEVAEYWVNDGIYGSMNCLLYDHAILSVRALHVDGIVDGSESLESTIFGPTCDGLDTVMQNVRLPRMQCGDWLLFPRMGAYTKAAASSFNGFDLSEAITVHVCSMGVSIEPQALSD